MQFKVGYKVIFTAKPDYCDECQQDSGKICEVSGIRPFGSLTLFKIKVLDSGHVWLLPESTLSSVKNYQYEFSFMREYYYGI